MRGHERRRALWHGRLMADFIQLQVGPGPSEHEWKPEGRLAETRTKARSPMAKKQREETEDDEVPDGENLTAEQLDIASVEMLHNYTDVGLRNFAEQCRHWRKMAK